MIDPLTRKVRPLSRRKDKKPLSEEVKSAYRLLNVTVAILGVSATLSYLYLNSLKPAKGYTLKQMQIDNEQLQAENRDLEREIIDARSYIQLQNSKALKGMESADGSEFSFVDESNVAKNNNEERTY
jgi:hypothetical protein